jgi:ectoine hydroxylase-related dioxygenase (phytanoyl-CoA dioxygenase family)
MNDSGYAIINSVLQPQDVVALATACTRIDVTRTRIGAGARHLLTHPLVQSLAQDARLLHIAKQFLRHEPIPFRATLFDKSPQSNWLVAWHQDRSLPLMERRDASGWGPWTVKAGIIYAHAPAEALARVIAIRIHLDDSESDNGPLRVLPGTHTLGVPTDDQIAHLSQTCEAMDCLVLAGGAIAMRPLLLHASSKARSDRPRRVLHIEYADSIEMGDGLKLALA